MASLVIKVKYEETLRRFNVAINGDQRLDLSMEGLRLKICSLFNLPSNAEFRLTYKDEDDDLVTLVDDDDLHDIVRQGLDPVRITVHLNSFTPNSQQNPNPDVAKISNTVQQPLAHALSKLSLDISSNASSSTSPNLTDLSDDWSKVGQSHVNAAFFNSGATSVTRHDKFGKDSKINSDGRTHEGIENVDIDKRTQATGVGVSVKPSLRPPFSFDKYKNASCESSSNKMSRSGGTKNKVASARKKGVNLNYDLWRSVKELPAVTYDQVIPQFHSSNRSFNKADSTGSIFHEGITCDGCGVLPITGPRFMSKVRYDYDLCSNCFSEIGNDTDYTRIDKSVKYKHPDVLFADSLDHITHKGVGCDGCGVLPITGPRFKSKVKYDYDLCSICFSRMGNVIDYTRIDFPLAYKNPPSFKAPIVTRPCMMRPQVLKHLRSRLDSHFVMDVNVMDGTILAPLTPFTKIWRMFNNGTLPWNRGLQLIWIGGDRFTHSDSIEMQIPSSGVDVSRELDIAVDFIAPELPGRYISYWRMAELSGHRFGQRVWVQIQVNPSVDLTRERSLILNLNLPPDSNEIAFPEVVDVKAESGLDLGVGESSTPSMFGQNNNIQMVGPSFPINDDLLPDASADRLASPGASPTVSYPKVDAYSYHMPDASSADRPASPVASPTVSYPEADRPVSLVASSTISYPEVDAYSYHIPEASSADRPISPVVTSTITYPEVDAFSHHIREASGPLNVQDNKSALDKNVNLEPVDEETEVEEKLLKDLEQIGFKQTDLNKEVDLGRSVDDLSDVSEWDPILEELKEMGFEDKDTNKKLLAKNNGSISRAVMDLIAEEEA